MKVISTLALLAFGAILAGCPGGGGGGGGDSSGGNSNSTASTASAPAAEAAAYNPSTGQPLGGSTGSGTTTTAGTPVTSVLPAVSNLDLTCVVVWNDQTNGKQMGGFATDVQTVLFAEHYHPGVGTRLRFVGSDGVAVERRIAAIRELGPANAVDNYLTDIARATLDQPLPDTVHPAPVVAYSGSGFIDDQANTLHWVNLTSSDYVAWPETGLIARDSGSPVLAVINGRTSLVSVVTRTNSGPVAATVLAANP